MRVAWVHPSWRDLVIDHLSSDAYAREHFLRNCSVHGALLALSVAGGRGGDRELPLLKRDADWDALTDRLHDLVPELEPAELIGLMDALLLMTRDARKTSSEVEAEALASAVLSRLKSLWKTTPGPITLAELEMWLTLAAQLSAKPYSPAIAITWAELLPIAAPDLSDRASLERFADWLALVNLLLDHDPDVLAGLGFPGHTPQVCETFLSSLEDDNKPVQPCDIGQTVRALSSLPRVVPELTDRANSIRFRLKRLEHLSTPSPTRTSTPNTAQSTGHLDVQRVLNDL
jgi:hypothetical protein